MNKEQLTAMETWARLNIAVMQLGEYHPGDAHCMPKGKLVEAFEALIYLIGKQGQPAPVKFMDPSNQLDKAYKAVCDIYATDKQPVTVTKLAAHMGITNRLTPRKRLDNLLAAGKVEKVEGGFIPVKKNG